MSFIIATSANQNDSWIIQGRISNWYVELVSKRYANDLDLISELEMSIVYGLLPLHDIYSTNPQLALRLQQALIAVADEIIRGEFKYPDEWGQSMQDNRRASFMDLTALLARFRQG